MLRTRAGQRSEATARLARAACDRACTGAGAAPWRGSAAAVAAVEPARLFRRYHLEHGDDTGDARRAGGDARRLLGLGRGDQAHEVNGGLFGDHLDGVPGYVGTP